MRRCHTLPEDLPQPVDNPLRSLRLQPERRDEATPAGGPHPTTQPGVAGDPRSPNPNRTQTWRDEATPAGGESGGRRTVRLRGGRAGPFSKKASGEITTKLAASLIYRRSKVAVSQSRQIQHMLPDRRDLRRAAKLPGG
jgi:hypothetical protein